MPIARAMAERQRLEDRTRSTLNILVNTAGVYAKAGEFFEEQGGPSADWGHARERVAAASLDEAHRLGIEMRRERFPGAHKTIGEV